MEASETEVKLAALQDELAGMLADLKRDLPPHEEKTRSHLLELQAIGKSMEALQKDLDATAFPAPPIPPAGAMKAHFAKTKLARGPHFQFDELASVAALDIRGDMRRELERAGVGAASPDGAAAPERKEQRSPSPPQPDAAAP